jgi:hypothetical protein
LLAAVRGDALTRAHGFGKAAASVLNLKFATFLGSRAGELQIQKNTLESTFSSVAYDSEIRSELSIDTWRISESPH